MKVLPLYGMLNTSINKYYIDFYAHRDTHQASISTKISSTQCTFWKLLYDVCETLAKVLEIRLGKVMKYDLLEILEKEPLYFWKMFTTEFNLNEENAYTILKIVFLSLVTHYEELRDFRDRIPEIIDAIRFNNPDVVKEFTYRIKLLLHKRCKGLLIK